MRNRPLIVRLTVLTVMAGAAIGATAGVASAEQRNFCSDMANKRRADHNGGITQEIEGFEISWGDPLELPEGYEETFGDSALC